MSKLKIYLFIIFWGLNFHAASQSSIIIEDIYAYSEDYNIRKAKEKSFKSALSQAVDVLIAQENLSSKIARWKLFNAISSYQIKEEKIENNKYSALFDVYFNKQQINNFIKSSRSNILTLKRLIYIAKNDLVFLDWVSSLAKLIDLPLYNYEEINNNSPNDIIITYISNNDEEFIISIEENNYVLNLTADNLKENFLILLNVVANEFLTANNANRNIFIMNAVPEVSRDFSSVSKFLLKSSPVIAIENAGYQASNLPIYLIKLQEENDLLLSYMYNNKYYTLNNLRFFKQIINKLHENNN